MTARCRNFEPARAAGFTLLELLVSMAILALLLVILATIVDNATKLWRQSENRVDSYREARAALNLVEHDLQSLYLTREVNPTSPLLFALNTTTGLPSTALPPIDSSNIFFLAALPTSDQSPTQNKSDLCTIGYFVAYDSPTLNQQKKSLNLYRFFRSSDQTFPALSDGQPLARGITTGPSGEEVLARNIVDFQIKGHIVDRTTGAITDYPNTTGTPPNYFDIQLTTLNNEVVDRFKTKDDLRDDTNPTFKQQARTFTARVNVSAARPQ